MLRPLTNNLSAFMIYLIKALVNTLTVVLTYIERSQPGGIPLQSTQTQTRIDATKTTPSTLRAVAAITLLLLAIQFLIGMVANLFVQVPDVHPGTQAPNYFVGVVQGVAWALVHSQLALLLHVVVGLLLGLASFTLLGLAIASRQRAWIVTTIIGWIGIAGAGFNGASFLNYGHNFSSLLMSIGFILAVVSYAIGFYITR